MTKFLVCRFIPSAAEKIKSDGYLKRNSYIVRTKENKMKISLNCTEIIESKKAPKATFLIEGFIV